MKKNFLSSSLRKDGKNKEEIKGEVGKATEEETGQTRIRVEEREENETVIFKRRCINSVSTDAFEILSHGEMSERCLIRGVTCGMILVGCLGCVSGVGSSGPVVPAVPVSPFLCGNGDL